ncbi:MAG: DNA methyltransferase [Gemmatimonadetes bacterium]|nr:DNA methyltransferase [Gemmatimonadota bacterium]
MTAERTDRFDRLVKLLKELFQLDKPDLDFGFYRIMHAKEAEVTQFLEVDLLPQVKRAFQKYRSADQATLEQQLGEAERDARGLGVDPDAAPKVKELREAIDAGTDVDALEADVYDHLYRFFRRYYSEGDFISQRVYKDGVYAIPYQGEEVKLHWANADQYYIKTTEYLKDYSFRLRPEAESDPMRVHFRLADAAEGEHGNIKAADEKARRFVLSAEDFVAEEEGPDGVRGLVIRFEYRAATLGDWPKEKRKGKKRPPQQKDLNEAAASTLLDANDLSLDRWMNELAVTHVKADGTQAAFSRLRSHLDRYTARNTYDYFIHKDLGGFLWRELDFYVKNEVMRLDDIEHERAPPVEEWLSKIKVIRTIAHKIIDFLAQLEGFQKKLWLKKKFVVETSYCVAVQFIPKVFHAEIVANRAQHDEWVDLHGIDELAGDLARAGYSDPLTTEFLRAHPTLMVDTRHFSADFTERLLEALGTDGSLDEVTDGVLFHSENFQALRLMERRYRGRVDCVYIDPPYNTDASPILYKNNYQHSCWATLMADRFELSISYMTTNGVLGCAIDENELKNLLGIIEQCMPQRDIQIIAVNHYPGSGSGRGNVSNTHEYYIVAVPGGQNVLVGAKRPGGHRERNFRRSGQGENNFRWGRPNSFFAILVDSVLWEIKGMEKAVPLHADYPKGSTQEGWLRVYPIGRDGSERVWSRNYESARRLWQTDALKCSRNGTIIHVIEDTGRKVLTSAWLDKKFNAVVHGTNLLSDILGRSGAFSYPKSLYTVKTALDAVFGEHRCGSVLDYFAGSGTTAHAVIEMNREDDGDRSFVLVEMAHYFDTVLLPRVKKVTFSPEWRNGRPTRTATPEEAERSPRIVKIVRLESYEDTLNNLVVRRPEQVQLLLDENIDGGPNAAREDYIIRYMLDVETGDSSSLLDLSAFLDPFAYRLKVKRPGSDESREVAVDLVETFNWLLGLRVRRMSAARRYDAEFGNAGQSHSTSTVALKETPDGPWWFRTVEGMLPDDRRALVIWRNRPGGDEPDGIERDNAVLDAWFKQSGHDARQADFDLIYANGDHNLDSLKETDQTWTGLTIEDHFKRLMFEDAEGDAGAW